MQTKNLLVDQLLYFKGLLYLKSFDPLKEESKTIRSM